MAESLIPACPPPGSPELCADKIPPPPRREGGSPLTRGSCRSQRPHGHMQAPLDPAPLAGARDEDRGWVSCAHPCSPVDLSPSLLDPLWPASPAGPLPAPWGSQVPAFGGPVCLGSRVGSAAPGYCPWPGRAPWRGLEGLLYLQPGMNVRASRRWFALLGLPAHWVGSWITCLFFY